MTVRLAVAKVAKTFGRSRCLPSLLASFATKVVFRTILVVLLAVSLPAMVMAQTPHDTQLQNAIEALLEQHEGEIGLAIRSLHSDVHYEFNADKVMPTASLIKLPMLITTYRLADEKKVDLSTEIVLRQEDKVPGSGVLTEQFSDGVRLPFRDYLRLMIRYSDNTATNIVADQIGLKTTAETMGKLELSETKLHSKVYRGDTTVFPKRSEAYGIGSTTANEMLSLLSRLEAGELASDASTQEIKQHLLNCDDTSKLGARLPTDVKFAHKTGAIANCRTDAGIIYTSNGPVAVCFLSNKNKDQSWSDENAANVLAAKIGEIIVDRFGGPAADPRLREGSYGELVEAVQRTLNERLPVTLSIDGDFGPATRSAVEKFQRQNHIKESGVMTPETWKALGTLIEQDDPVPAPEIVNAEKLPIGPQMGPLDPPVVTCKAWAIADATGKIRFESNSTTSLEAASTTKIMTAFLVIRFADSHPDVLDEEVRFSKRADDTVGSTAGVRAGEVVSVRHLLYGLLLPSGNDASVALAEHFGSRLVSAKGTTVDQEVAAGSYGEFVEAMNLAAKEIGLEHAHYKNPHGLSDPEHRISAADLVRLTHEARRYSLFREINRTRQFGCVVEGEQGYRRNVIWKNTNRLLSIEGFSGVKTGTTSAAGACLVAVGERDGNELTTVVLGSSSSDARYADIRNLFHWAWRKRAVTGLNK